MTGANGRQEVVLVRHGETDWSRSGRHTGRTDLDLTAAGRAGAAALAPVLARRRFALVLVSPLRRSRETARLAGMGGDDRCAEVGAEVDVVVDPDLCEWDYGDYEGLTTAQIRETVPGWTVWSHPSPNGETVSEVGHRIDRVIARVRAVDGDVAVFGHGHALRVFGARWCGFDPTSGCRLALDPATVSVLGYERENAVIRAWNLRRS